MSGARSPRLGRLLDGIAGAILLGFGLLLMVGNLGQELFGRPYPAIAEGEFATLVAVLVGWGAVLVWLALRRPQGGR